MSPTTGTILDLLSSALAWAGAPLHAFLSPTAKNPGSRSRSLKKSPSEELEPILGPLFRIKSQAFALIIYPLARHQRNTPHKWENILRSLQRFFRPSGLGILSDFDIRVSGSSGLGQMNHLLRI
jgi:hypothetical protein